jgi:hypothetical protein
MRVTRTLAEVATGRNELGNILIRTGAAEWQQSAHPHRLAKRRGTAETGHDQDDPE